ncbi:hypothetical protein LCGC14_0335230 [marine sediment metagenome]|uniref:Protein kinase domain-containing protein n=1 Tax=marine sediment metagenome TaxID=412755 RepID=A0A0F9TKV7_9ZZZZ|nr:hypothetical protein [Phycisphaerae bacterium]HDZ43730.1 hypothetical protein [Phycisphaerae bacterium]
MTNVVRCGGPLLAIIRREHLDTVEGAFQYAGGEDLIKSGLGTRRRSRIRLTDDTGQSHTLYMKCYGCEGLFTRLRRWLRTGRCASQGAAEFANIERVRALDIRTMEPLVFGDDYAPLAGGRSFLLVGEVPGEALERCGEDVLSRWADRPERIDALTDQLADLVARLHRGGCVHQDLYASHLFLDEGADGDELYLIDLARVFRPRWRRFRWRVKDLAQLKYSMPARWVDGSWERFLTRYLGPEQTDLRATFEAAVDRRLGWMQRRHERKRSAGADSRPMEGGS